jgi:hypothetical protein
VADQLVRNYRRPADLGGPAHIEPVTISRSDGAVAVGEVDVR